MRGEKKKEKGGSSQDQANVVIYDYDISQKLRNDFMKDLKLSRPLTLERYEERSKMIRFKEGLARLIAPML